VAHRVVVVARTDVSSAAAEWAAAGLIGHALWLDADGLALDFEDPTRVTARLLRSTHEPADRSLAAEFADTRDLTEVRVVWVRDSTREEHAPAMGRLKDWVRRIVPQAGCSTLFFDLVVPADAEDAVVPEAPHEWQQFRVTPEDRPAPGLADAGFPSGERRVAVAMHAAAALAGLLGGDVDQMDGLGQADQHSIWNMHAFSRLVGGGDRIAGSAAEFRDRVLPTWSAAQLEDERFVAATAAQAEELVESVADWWCGQADGALGYRRPPSYQLTPPETLTLGQHLRNAAAFTRFALRSLFRFTPADARAWTTNHLLDTDDQGYRIEHETRIEESDLPDWAAQDAALRARIRESLDRAEDEAGTDTVPPERVWSSLATAACGVVDGGTLPEGCPTPLTRGQIQVVPPDCVAGPNRRVVAVTALPPGGRCAADLLGDDVASAAVDGARASLFDADAPLAITANKVSRTAMRLCTDLARADREERERQAGECTVVADVPGPVEGEASPTAEAGSLAKPPLLDRIRASVLADRLAARLDAERWTGMATSPFGTATGRLAITGWNGDAPSEAMRDQERGFRRRLGATAGVVLALLAVWTWFREPIVGFLASTLGVTVAAGVGFAVIAAIGLLGVGWTATKLFRAYTAFLERGRRLLEARRGLEVNAQEAWTSYSRLTNVDAILARWCRVIAGVLPVRESPGPPVGLPFPVVPAALRFGEPELPEEELTRAMAAQGAAPGWRLKELRTLVRVATSVKDMEELVGDKGLVSGALDRLVKELDAGAPQAESRRQYLGALAQRVRPVLAGRPVSVPRISNPTARETVGSDGFMAEVATNGASYTAGKDLNDPDGQARATLNPLFASSPRDSTSIRVGTTERLTDVVVRVSMTPHDRDREFDDGAGETGARPYHDA